MSTNIKKAKAKILASLKADLKNKKQGNERTVIGLQGGAGVGKSESVVQVVKEFAEFQKLEFVENTSPTEKQYGFGIIQCSNTTASDLAIPTPTEDRKELRYAFNLSILPTKGSGTMLLDEVSQGDTDVQQLLMALLRQRGLNGYLVPEGWTFVCAYNRPKDHAGASPVLKTLVDRATNIFDIEVDADAWIDWGTKNDIHPHVLALVKADNTLLDTLKDVRRGENGSTPRSMQMLSDEYKNILDGHYDEVGMTNKEIYTSVVGEQVGESFNTFLELVKEIPNVNDILKNPEDVETVDEPNVRYLLTFGLAHKVKSEKHFKNAMTYLQTFNQSEYVTVFATALINKVPELAETKIYTDLKLTNYL